MGNEEDGKNAGEESRTGQFVRCVCVETDEDERRVAVDDDGLSHYGPSAYVLIDHFTHIRILLHSKIYNETQ